MEDGKSHVIEWNRGPGGKMAVTLDGKPTSHRRPMWGPINPSRASSW